MGFTINLNDTGGAAPGTQAGDGFIAAANIWQNLISDPITINLDVGFAELEPGVLGSTGSTFNAETYSNIRDALINKQSSNADNYAIHHLQKNNNLAFITNNRTGNLFLDNNNSVNNNYLSVTTANLKALGLLNDTGDSDGSITFSNTFNFDFDSSDGIDSDAFDFVGVATHEIGHALGFVSGVDTLDFFSGQGPNAGSNIDFNQYAIFNTLDLFRYSLTSLEQGEGIQDLAIKDRGQFFSLDGGENSIATFATGTYNGDGRQASHWKDNRTIGLLDPTIGRGEIGALTDTDLLAFDSIGYALYNPIDRFPGFEPIEENQVVNTVNTPSTLGCFIFGLYVIMRLRKNQNFKKLKVLNASSPFQTSAIN